MEFISQSPGASCSLCSSSTPCLSSKQYFAPSCFSWLPLEPPEPITLGSRFGAALLPSNSSGISTFPGTLQGFYEMPCRAHSSSQTSPCLSPPPAVSVIHITPPAILMPLFPLPTDPKNTTHVCYGSLYFQSLSWKSILITKIRLPYQ